MRRNLVKILLLPVFIITFYWWGIRYYKKVIG